MSQADVDKQSRLRRRYWPWVTGLAVLLGGVYFLSKPRVQPPTVRGGATEDSLGLARAALAHSTDLGTCRTALQQINTFLSQNPQGALSPVPREELKKGLGLDEEELGEIATPTYTALDGSYLEQCLLLRDGVQALQMRGGELSPLKRATAAFHWTMRQVRLEEHPFLLAPSSYVLRRGWGSSLERGLVFLELLRQVSPARELQGCLVYCPDDKTNSRLWACGVIVGGGSEIHLFDPRLGLPLPGLAGQGVATLRQAHKDPAVLGQLTVSDKRYDVTAEQAGRAELRLVCSLSSLAPRMELLQDKLLGAACPVRLAASAPDEFQRLRQAARAELGKEAVVLAWQEPLPGGPRDGAGLLRRFLPPEEGGCDKPNPEELPRKQQFAYSLQGTTIPSPFNDIQKFPPNAELGRRVHLLFRYPVLESVIDSSKPRTLILKGHFSKANRALVDEQDRLMRSLGQRSAAGELRGELDDWVNEMIRLYAEEARQARTNPAQVPEIRREIDEKWNKATALGLLFAEATAPTRLAQLRYLQGLSKQEEAERKQAWMESRKPGGVNPDEAKETRDTWVDALDNWEKFLQEYPADPACGAVRQLQARALAQLGRWQEAASAWETATFRSPLEKVAALYQAQQIRKANQK